MKQFAAAMLAMAVAQAVRLDLNPIEDLANVLVQEFADELEEHLPSYLATREDLVDQISADFLGELEEEEMLYVSEDEDEEVGSWAQNEEGEFEVCLPDVLEGCHLEIAIDADENVITAANVPNEPIFEEPVFEEP